MVSRHTLRRAIDMYVRWTGTFSIFDREIEQMVNVTSNTDLWDVAETYGIIKNEADAPYWSDSGH